MLISARAAAGLLAPVGLSRERARVGFVVQGAEIVDVRDSGAVGHLLVLETPGAWCDGLLGRRWLPGRGGPPLLAWGWTTRLATG